jgi:uncharacterized protein with von Willebrand factor type A (vWA) domain
MVKDERHLDRFDHRAFAQYVLVWRRSGRRDVLEATEIPTEWLRKLAKQLSQEERAEVRLWAGLTN